MHIPRGVVRRAARLGCGKLQIIAAAILERPVIEKILTHMGLEPQPPSPDTSSPVDCSCLARGRAREAGQDFAT